MKKSSYFGSIVLIILLGLFCAAGLIYRLVAPLTTFPGLDLMMVILLALLAKVIQGCVQGSLQSDVIDIVIAALGYGLLPLCAGLVSGVEAVKLLVLGGIFYALVGFFLQGSCKRSSLTKVHKLPLIINALILFLAFQGLSGLWL